jgi:hypothetical protein
MNEILEHRSAGNEGDAFRAAGPIEPTSSNGLKSLRDGVIDRLSASRIRFQEFFG